MKIKGLLTKLSLGIVLVGGITFIELNNKNTSLFLSNGDSKKLDSTQQNKNADPVYANFHYRDISNTETEIDGCENWSVENLICKVPATNNGKKIVGIGDAIGRDEGVLWKCRFTSIDLSEATNLRYIGRRAFEECNDLQSFSWDVGAKANVVIKQNAFKGCTGLKSINITGSNLSLHPQAFVSMPALQTVNLNVATIGLQCFMASTKIQTLTLGSNTRVIAGGAFQGCTNLASVDFSHATNLQRIDRVVFENDIALTSVDLSNCTALRVNKQYDVGWFKSCQALTNAVLPTSIDYIPLECFMNCTNLSSVRNINGHAILPRAFLNCTSLHSVELSANTYIINDDAFKNSGVNTITGNGSNLELIDDNAFYGCNLTYVNAFLNLPENSNFVFFSKYEGETLVGGFLEQKEQARIARAAGCIAFGHILINEQVRGFASFHSRGAFEGCYGITAMEFPSDFYSIDDQSQNGALGNLPNLTRLEGHLSNESLGEIASNNFKFFRNDQHQNINFYIHHNGFEEFKTLYEKYYDVLYQDKIAFVDADNVYNWDIDSNGKVSPANKTTLTGDVYVPTKVNGINVTGLKDSAFAGAQNLRSVYFSDAIRTIPDATFDGCTNLVSVSWSENNTINTVGTSAFSHCNSLTSFPFEKITNFNNLAFNACTSLNSITFANSGVNFGEFVFSECSNLQTINLPSDLTSINQGLFHQCTKLNNVSLPNSLNVIKLGAFSGCSGLTSITIPSNVTSIEQNAFSQAGLTKVIFDDKTTPPTIDQTAFSSNEDLHEVLIQNNYKELNNQTITDENLDEIKTNFKNAFKNQQRIPSDLVVESWLDNDIAGDQEITINSLNENRFSYGILEGFKKELEILNAQYGQGVTRSLELEINASESLNNKLDITANFNGETNDEDYEIIHGEIQTKQGVGPNIQSGTAVVTPKVVYTKDNNNLTFKLKTLTVNVEANDNFDVGTPEYTKAFHPSTRNEDGLWVRGDRLQIPLIVNKAYFGQYYNDTINNIYDHLLELVTFKRNGQTIQFTKFNDRIYINPLVGDIAWDINEIPGDSNNLSVQIAVRNRNISNYQDAKIDIFFNKKSLDTPIFSFKTFAGNHFRPDIHTINSAVNPVNFSFADQTNGTVTWNLDTQQNYPNVAVNDFAWYRAHGYTFNLDLNGFSNEYITLKPNTFTLNNDNTQFSLGLSLTKPNIEAINNLTVSNLKVVVAKDSDVHEFTLPSFKINSSANKTISAGAVSYSLDNRISNDRQGLWFGNDSLTEQAVVSKAFFNNDWNNIEAIKTNFNNYFTIKNQNNKTLALTPNGQNAWYNSEIGTIIFDINNGSENTTYALTFRVAKSYNNKTASYSDQQIKLFISNNPDQSNSLFSFRTYAPNAYQPNLTFATDQGSDVNLSLNNRSSNTTWNLTTQTWDSQIAKNDFSWYVRNGYSLRLDTSSFTNQYISLDNRITLNPNQDQLSLGINLTTPNLSPIHNLVVNGLKVIASKGSISKEIALPRFVVNASANNDVSRESIKFTPNSQKSVNRDGLWISGDNYHVVIDVNKTYFGSNADNVEWIRQNLDSIFTIRGNDVYSFTNKHDNVYSNRYIGQMTVTSITPLTGERNNDYEIILDFTLPNSIDYQLLDQDINFFVNNAPSGEALFKIHTYDKDHFDPDFNEFTPNDITLTTGERSGTLRWNDHDQTEFATLGNTNTCKWAISKGYQLSLSSYSNDYVQLQDNLEFDPATNLLSVGIKQTKAVKEQTIIEVSNLSLLIKDGSTLIRSIALPTINVTLGASSSDVNNPDVVYNSASGAAATSLLNNGDVASFDLIIPQVLLPNDDEQLINQLKFIYDGEGQDQWTWDSVPPKGGVYKFQYHHDDETYTLTYQRVEALIEDINPRITYHITLTQEFDAKVKSNINFHFVGASSGGVVDIKADEYVPPVPPAPSGINLGLILGIIFGSIFLIGLIILLIVIIRRKRKYK